MKALILAGGAGTRLRPITHAIPKPVVPVGNVAIVEQLVRLLAAHGADEVIANLHWFPEQVRGRLGDGSEFGVEVTYRREEELLGTAESISTDGTLQIRPLSSSPIASPLIGIRAADVIHLSPD